MSIKVIVPDEPDEPKKIQRKRKTYMDMTPSQSTEAIVQIITGRGKRPKREQARHVQSLVMWLEVNGFIAA